MAEQDGIYKCSICGNVVSVIEAHAGTLVCCGKNMELLKAKTSESEGKEKHVPVVIIKNNNVTVKVGSVEHPMQDAHYIELIHILRDNKVVAEKRVYPGQKPEAIFCLESTDKIKARILCNIHGLWKN